MPEKNYLEAKGDFECVVEESPAGWFSESGEKGTPCIRLPLRVTEGLHKGKITVWRGWLSEAAIDGTIESLTKAFGFNGDLEALHAGKYSFARRPCNITMDTETYQGKAMFKVRWINPPGGHKVKPMDEGKVKSILSKLGKTAVRAAKAAKAEVESNGGKLPSGEQVAAPAPSQGTTQGELTAGQTAAEYPAPEEDDAPF
jgi:hypothetical protein